MTRLDFGLATFCLGSLLGPTLEDELLRGTIAALGVPVLALALKLMDPARRRGSPFAPLMLGGLAFATGLFLSRPLPPLPQVNLTGALVVVVGQAGRPYPLGPFPGAKPARRLPLRRVEVRSPTAGPLPNLTVEIPLGLEPHAAAEREIEARGYLLRKRGRLLLRVRSWRPRDAPSHEAMRALTALRRELARRIDDGLEGTANTLAHTLLLGRPLDDGSLRETARRAGVSHLLVVSGLHLGLIALAIGPRPRRRFVFGVLALYAALVGGSAPVLRALVALGLTWGATAVGRRPAYGRGLLLAATTTLLLWPERARDLSFVLSFSAVAGMLVFEIGPERHSAEEVPDLDDALAAGAPPSWPRRILTATRLGLAASLGTAPACLATFGTISPWAPLTSWLLAPLVALLIALALVAMVAPGLGLLMRAPAELFRLLLIELASWPGARLERAPLDPVATSGLVLGLALIAAALNRRPRPRRRHRRALLALATVLTLAVFGLA